MKKLTQKSSVVLRILIVVAATTALPTLSKAAGLEYGPQGLHAVGRGGAFTVGADDASAIYWNPSRLALFNGTQVLANLNMSLLDESFKRSAARKQKVSVDSATQAVTYGDYYDPQPDGYPHEFNPVSNTAGVFPLGASVLVTSDFGLEDWGFGIGFHAPTAVGKVTFSKAFDASNKYFFTGMDTAILFVDFAAAWKYREWFGIGVTMQYVMVPYLKYSMNIMGPAGATSQNNPINNVNDIQADVNVSDWGAFSMMVGAWVRPFNWYRPLRKLEIGLCARAVPIEVDASGTVGISGDTDSVYKNYKTSVPGKIGFTYPAHVQTGIRWAWEPKDREIFDIELDYVWEQWSALDAFYMKTLDVFKGPGDIPIDQMNIRIARSFKDSHSVRLGGQWNAIENWLTVRLGGWWESAAQPNEYTNLDLPSWERWGLGFGLSTNVYGFEVGFSYNHIFQESREVTDGQIRQQIINVVSNGDSKPVTVIRPGYAVNNGSYSGSIDVFTLGLSYTFGRKAKTVVIEPQESPAEPGQPGEAGESGNDTSIPSENPEPTAG